MAVNKVIKNRTAIIRNLANIYDELFDTSKLESEQTELEEELHVIAQMVDKCINDNAKTGTPSEDFEKRYNKLIKRYERTRARLDEVSAEIVNLTDRQRVVSAYIKQIKKQKELVSEFSETMLTTLLDYATVHSRQKVIFTFKDGTDIEVGLDE